MTTLEKRLTDFAGRTDVSDSNASFAKSLLSNYKKWSRLTPKQETAFTRMEARYSPEAQKERENWETNFTSEMREKARIMAHYYQANPPYFGDLATRILTEEGYVPSEKAARFYATALAESKKELLQRDTWTDSSLHIQDNTFYILQRNLGLVYNSGTKVVHEITFEKVNKVSVDELELPVPPSS